jgi:cell division protein FtsA
LAVDETVFEALAACYAAVLPEDRGEGTALADIGAHSTELVVYYGDALQLASTIPICGDHFTRDIAHFLRISLEDAALVKEQYGSASAASTSENSFIELPMPDGREARETPRRKLNEIIEARAEELFKLVRLELARVGMDRGLTSGLVLTGAASQLHGMCDLAERVLDCPARIGLPVGIMNWPEALVDPAWATAAGLAMYSARLHTQVDLERQSVGLLGRMLR